MPQADLPLPGFSSLTLSAQRYGGFQAQQILKISRVVLDIARAQTFYQDALGFRRVARSDSDHTATVRMAAPNEIAEEVVMRLGAQEIALVQFATQGSPYPRASTSDDLWFQHLAIVVNDMDAAYSHLCSCAGWCPISDGGPQQLPSSNGDVRAFKFRDPDDHPLELIWFPPAQGNTKWHGQKGAMFLGIDHSALSVASTSKSVRFYRALGFHVSKRSLNISAAQACLDGIPDAHVRVTSLRPKGVEGPGLELLCYRPTGRSAAMSLLNDQLTEWLTVAVGPLHQNLPLAMQDPDGHRLYLVDDKREAT